MKRVAFALSFAVVGASVPVPTNACGNATRAETNVWVRAIKQAEAALQAQKYTLALARLEAAAKQPAAATQARAR